MRSASTTTFPGLSVLLALFLLVTAAMADWDLKYCSSQNTASNNSPFYWDYQSNGKCHDHCVAEGDYAFFVIQDKNCWCSNYVPAQQTDLSDCSETCPGFDSENCGKKGQYYIYVELNGNPSGTMGASQPSSSTSSSSSKSTSTKPSPTTTTDNDSLPDSTGAPQTQIRTVTDNGGVIVTQTLLITPSATAQPERTGHSKTNTGAIVGGVVGGVGALALIVGGIFFLLWRRRKQRGAQSAPGEQNEGGVHRYASTMSKSGLLRGEKQPTPIATSFSRRPSRGLDQESVSPISASDRRNSTFRIADQRLNPSTIFVFDNTSRASVGSLDDSRDYHRTLNVRNPDAQ